MTLWHPADIPSVPPLTRMPHILRSVCLRVARNSASVFLAVRISSADVYNINH
jgi:hypothetical protein